VRWYETLFGGDKTMYANVAHTAIDMSRLEQAVAGIDGVKQRLMSLRGFSGAYWLEPIEGHGMMVSLWDDEQAARDAAPPVGFSPAPGVTVERVETRQVIGQA
jgi:hypothetical protein